MPIFAVIITEMESLWEKTFFQHYKETTAFRIKREQEDTQESFEYLRKHDPYIESQNLLTFPLVSRHLVQPLKMQRTKESKYLQKMEGEKMLYHVFS